jgi:hypothetical protein
MGGDQIVTLKIVTPPADTAAKTFYERMERELPKDLRVKIRY